MKLYAAHLFLLPTLGLMVSCGGEVEDRVSEVSELNGSFAEVVGGSAAPVGSHPWLVSIYLDGNFRCGGTLIRENWVLTAGHCVSEGYGREFDDSRIRVVLGDRSLTREERGETEVSVDRVVSHDHHEIDTLVADIALLRLEDSATLSSTVQLMDLPTEDEENARFSDPLRTIGWGRTVAGSETITDGYPSVPHRASFRMRNEFDCGTQRNIICGAPRTSRSSASICSGDSGSPGYRRINDSIVQYGIVSYSGGSVEGEYCAQYSAFTEVAAFRGWIDDTIESMTR